MATVVEVPYSHLFPGMMIALPRDAEPILAFADGSRAAATLVNSEQSELLWVAAYTTRAGTDIPEKLWTFRNRQDSDMSTMLTLGPALPPPPPR